MMVLAYYRPSRRPFTASPRYSGLDSIWAPSVTILLGSGRLIIFLRPLGDLEKSIVFYSEDSSKEVAEKICAQSCPHNQC